MRLESLRFAARWAGPFVGAAVAPDRKCATIDHRDDRATVKASVDPRFGLRYASAAPEYSGKDSGEMAEKEALKQVACRTIEQLAEQLIRTSDWLADHPELGLQEVQAARRLTGLLDEFGARVERGIAGRPTAFYARLPAGQPGPRVAILAEL